MENWLISMKKADFKSIAERFNINPITARLIRNREIIEDAEIERYLNGNLNDLYPPSLMKDMEKACMLLFEKIKQRKPIRIIGDYDIDGVTSTYILLTGLKRLGADADEKIPDRIKDGYGLNERLIKEAFFDGKDTIITCDNGISAYDQIKTAKKMGMTVIITDHHEVFTDEKTGSQTVPLADAVVDPKRTDCAYPYKEICGAVVAWKLITLMYEKSGIPKEEADEFLEFAAIATIGDVCELKDENRIIVKFGLEKLRRTEHLGLKALMSLNNIDQKTVDTYHIGFIIGPCLNAVGRLASAQTALDLLTAKTPEQALELASALISMNLERKEMTEKFASKAFEQVENSSLIDDKVLVVYIENCHESIAGIIAGRLREKYGRPSFVLTKAEKGLKGSGRSIEEYPMYEELSSCKDLLTAFGGHKMAAGLSLPEKDLENLRSRLNARCTLSQKDLCKKVHLDMILPIEHITRELIDDFEKLKPFGNGNKKPLFALKDFRIIHPFAVGKNKNAVKMRLLNGRAQADAVFFGDAKAFISRCEANDISSVAFYPSVNTFRGRDSIQIVLTDFR